MVELGYMYHLIISCIHHGARLTHFLALPRFADKDSFEYEYGVRWKRLYEMYKEKKMLLESDLQAEIDQLERRLAIVKHEHETEKLRQGRRWLLRQTVLYSFTSRAAAGFTCPGQPRGTTGEKVDA